MPEAEVAAPASAEQVVVTDPVQNESAVEQDSGAGEGQQQAAVQDREAVLQKARERLNKKYTDSFGADDEAEPAAEKQADDKAAKPDEEGDEQISAEPDQSSDSEGEAATSDDSLSEELTQRAKSFGLSDAQIRELGSPKAVEAALGFVTDRLLNMAKADQAQAVLQTQSKAEPAAAQQQQKVTAPAGLVIPEGLEETYPELAPMFKTISDQFSQMQQGLQANQAFIQQQQATQVQTFLNSKFDNDKKYGAFLKDPKSPHRQSVAVMMDAINGAAQRAGMNLSPDELYVQASRAALADKHEEIIRKEFQTKLDRTKQRASIRPTGRTNLQANATMEEKRARINQKHGGVV